MLGVPPIHRGGKMSKDFFFFLWITNSMDLQMICVSAGKSVGEIACRRCEGMGSRGKVVGWLKRRSLDTSAFVRLGGGMGV